MSRSLSTSFWFALSLPLAFFFGQALFPAAALYTRTLSPDAIDWIGAVPKLVFSAMAGVLATGIWRRFEKGNPSKTAWLLLAAGLLGLAAGQVILSWFFLTLGRKDVFPSIGDLFFVAGSLAVVAALVLFLRAYHATGFPLGDRRKLGWAAAGATLASAAVVFPLLRPIVQAPAPALEKLLNVTYPVLDFLMLIPALLLLRVSFRFRGGRIWAVWSALLAGIFATAVADILFGYVSGLGYRQLESLLDILYILGYGCFAAAVLYQRHLLES